MFHCFICLLPVPEIIKFLMKLLRSLIYDRTQICASVVTIKSDACLWNTFLALTKCHHVKARVYSRSDLVAKPSSVTLCNFTRTSQKYVAVLLCSYFPRKGVTHVRYSEVRTTAMLVLIYELKRHVTWVGLNVIIPLNGSKNLWLSGAAWKR